MQLERTLAIVLRRTNLGEADRVVQVLTPTGVRGVVARGVRRERSKLAAGIEPFAINELVIAPGRRTLANLRSARPVTLYRSLLGDYDRLQAGYRAMRLVGQAARTIDEPDWFELLAELLAALDDRATPLGLTLTRLGLRHGALLGHELDLRRDSYGHPLTADQTYRYDPSERGLQPDPRGDLTGDHIKLLRLLAAHPATQVAQVGGINHLVVACQVVAQRHGLPDQ